MQMWQRGRLEARCWPFVADEWLNEASRPIRPARVDSSVPNVARVWNCLIGGRDNFESDRRAARQLVATSPLMAQVGPAARAFLRRAVTYLAADAGIRQFLDVGAGMPATGNTHEVAQAVDPSCRVVLVDNDPVVLSHARALLRSAPEGASSFVEADARDTRAVIDGAREILDLTRPVGVILTDVLNFVEDAADVLVRLADEVPSGSYLAVLQPSRDERLVAVAHKWNQLGPVPVFLRDRRQVASWLGGLEVIDPGIVEAHEWRPERGDPELPVVPLLCAVAQKPLPARRFAGSGHGGSGRLAEQVPGDARQMGAHRLDGGFALAGPERGDDRVMVRLVQVAPVLGSVAALEVAPDLPVPRRLHDPVERGEQRAVRGGDDAPVQGQVPGLELLVAVGLVAPREAAVHLGEVPGRRPHHDERQRLRLDQAADRHHVGRGEVRRRAALAPGLVPVLSHAVLACAGGVAARGG
jgi:hypothetical protein